MFQSGVGSGAPRGSWPGSLVPPSSAPQKWKTLPSRLTQTSSAGHSLPSGARPR